jgi:hypothetical protein
MNNKIDIKYNIKEWSIPYKESKYLYKVQQYRYNTWAFDCQSQSNQGNLLQFCIHVHDYHWLLNPFQSSLYLLLRVKII